jgi:porin
LKEGRIALGAWAHSGDFDRFDGGVEEGTYGFHFTAEQRLWARGDRGLHAFVQYGWADQAVSDFAQHMGAGLVLRGTSDARSGDSAGLYATWADLSDEPAAGFDRDELAFDAYYRLELAPAVFVQPEIQYIVNPSGDPTIDNAIVGGLRVGVTF